MAKRAGQGGGRRQSGMLLICLIAWEILSGFSGWSQNQASGKAGPRAETGQTLTGALLHWEGLPVRRITFEGVSTERLAPLPGHLPQAEGAPLRREELRKSLRQLYSTGLFDTIAVEGRREPDGVVLIFRGQPRAFIGTVNVYGAKGTSINTQLERASQLSPGSRFTQDKLNRAYKEMQALMAQDGFHEPVITHTLTPTPQEQLVDIAFQVANGPQARVGSVEVTGDTGMSADKFRHAAHLTAGARVDRETVNRALSRILKVYQREERLEAEIKLESQQYIAASHTINFRFTANRGPVVKLRVTGASVSPERLKRLIPIFEEGSVDDDLLNEGNRRLRDLYQQQGYFDVKVEHERKSATPNLVTIIYKVQLGPRRRVERVSVAGNRFFDTATLKELLSVHAADTVDHRGMYSQSLVTADVNALQAVYQNNGFSQVKVTPEITPASGQPLSPKAKTAPLAVVYHIEEGTQRRVGVVHIEGNQHVDTAQLSSQLSTVAGQLFSPQNLAGDRNALLTDYLSRGFDQVQVEVAQKVEPADASKMDVTFRITEGRQIFVRKVYVTGLHYTHPNTVAKAITLHPGDPLNETALMETQSNLYDFALFNEVNPAILNPSGSEAYKTVLLQTAEARRWVLTYGAGLEAQTGTPHFNCGGVIAAGSTCNPEGKTGVSHRILGDVTRNNLFGREQSVSLRGNYGLLEQKLDLFYQNPRLKNSRNFGLTFSGGYANSLDVSTYVASRLEGGMRLTEHFNTPGSRLSKANTLVYGFDFRRVKVQASSLQVYPAEIMELSRAVRVAGPALTWIRDTRDSPLDAHRGTYTSFQDFYSSKAFGAQVDFNRLDISNSSYHSFSRGRFVLARNMRYGQERLFDSPQDQLIPLPERLYAGGATSLRGFSSNSAGPRDPETGYPIAGAGALILNTELRLPPPTLPWIGNSLSLVLFHDMGNVFTNAGDAWVSALRIHQPDRDNCKILTYGNPNPIPTGPMTSTGKQGECSFNYFSHAPGLGLRYHTPVGPVRLDFSYNLNPPIYPVNIDYSLYPASPVNSNPHVGEGRHFNVFFSLGQTF